MKAKTTDILHKGVDIFILIFQNSKIFIYKSGLRLLNPLYV